MTTTPQTEWTTDHREWYRTVYLESDHWAELRGRKLKANPTCERCPRRATDVHHVNYRNIFDVELTDLLSLCRPCHDAEHKENGMPRRPRVSFGRYFPPHVKQAMRAQKQAVARPVFKHVREMTPKELKEYRKRQMKGNFKLRRCPKRDLGPRIR